MGTAGNIFSLMDDFDAAILEGKSKLAWNDGWNNGEYRKEETMKTMKVTELKNGEHFQFVTDGKASGPVYKRIKGINQSIVKVSMTIEGIISSLNVNSTANVVKVDAPKAEKKKELIFKDLKIGDKFTFTYAKKYSWGKDWEEVFTKIDNVHIMFGDCKTPISINDSAKVDLVVSAPEEKKKQFTFGDLKVGDKFTVTITLSTVGKIKMEKVVPFKSNNGYWLNAKLMDKHWWIGCYEGTVLLDQQEIELIEAEKPVEKKLTIADLKPGEKFKFVEKHHGDKVYLRVTSPCSFGCETFLNEFSSVQEAKFNTEVERVVEEDKKTNKKKVVDLAVGDKFQLSKYKNNTFTIGFDLFKLTGFSYATVTCRNLATGKDWYFENYIEVTPVL